MEALVVGALVVGTGVVGTGGGVVGTSTGGALVVVGTGGGVDGTSTGALVGTAVGADVVITGGGVVITGAADGSAEPMLEATSSNIRSQKPESSILRALFSALFHTASAEPRTIADAKKAWTNLRWKNPMVRELL